MSVKKETGSSRDNTFKYWFKWFTPRRCGNCERIRFGVIRRRQKTDYYYDEDNYEAFCPKCQDYVDYLWRVLGLV